jgi:hypothetical protein
LTGAARLSRLGQREAEPGDPPLPGNQLKNEKIVLTTLCAVACASTASMLLGVVNLARHQDVPVLAVVFELSMFLGAGLLPLLAVWVFKQPTKPWLYIAWTPCILYVGFVAINFTRISPFDGLPRLLLWSAIIILFIRAAKESKPGLTTAGPPFPAVTSPA